MHIILVMVDSNGGFSGVAVNRFCFNFSSLFREQINVEVK